MHQLIVFETIFAEFGRALAAARRYEILRYGRAGHDHFAPVDIPRQIFEEFYARQSDAEHAALAPDRRRLLRPGFGL